MGHGRTDEFRKDAVRIGLTSGLTRRQVADDPGVGMSTLSNWITAHRDTDVVSKEDLSLAQENDRLRRGQRIYKEELDIMKKATQFFVRQKPRGSGSIEEHRNQFPTERLCRVMEVSARGLLRALRSRAASRRQ